MIISSRWVKILCLSICLLLFTALFLRNTTSDLSLIFHKDLYAHDESSNSVVAANITRRFFPPMVRVNPLVETQGNWMEGPFWQHIPPLFAYVPYVFFKLDGQITIEVKRLSYALLLWLTGGLFILFTFRFRPKVSVLLAATLAAGLWLQTPFTHALVTGYAFGVSDIVLAFTLVLSWGGILWYLAKERPERLLYGWKKIIALAFLAVLPIMAKSLLGAIPAATFLILLLWDHRRLSKRFWLGLIASLGFLLLYYLPLYFASPATFNKEILTAAFHFTDLEGWGRPWYYYFTEYLPHAYLFKYTWAFFAGLLASLSVCIFSKTERRTKILLVLPLAWFAWNLIAVSAVQSKIANFIFQTYLLGLFAICFALIFALENYLARLLQLKAIRIILMIVLLAAGALTARKAIWFADSFRHYRTTPYVYASEHEKFYQTAEQLRGQGADTRDLVIARISDDDCWFRYYPLFLTGSESKTLLELSFGYSAADIKNKYRNLYYVDSTLKPVKYDLAQMSVAQIQSLIDSKLAANQSQIQADITRIKHDTTSCQWLVPDSILNAP